MEPKLSLPGLALAYAMSSWTFFAGRHHQHLVAFGDLGDRRELLDRVVIAEAIDRRAHHQRARIAEQQRVAVGLGGGDGLGAERPAGAAAILDDHGLPEDRPQALHHEPRRDVDRASGRKRHHHLDQPVGIGLRLDAIGGARRSDDQRERAYSMTRGEHGRPPGFLFHCRLSSLQSSRLTSWLPRLL